MCFSISSNSSRIPLESEYNYALTLITTGYCPTHPQADSVKGFSITKTIWQFIINIQETSDHLRKIHFMLLLSKLLLLISEYPSAFKRVQPISSHKTNI